MSTADPEDAYASDDYEAESPTRSQGPVPSPSPIAQQQTLQFDTDELAEDESDAGAVTPLPRAAKARRSRTPRESDRISGRHLMDNTPWVYTVSAQQVRMLRIPFSKSAAVRELRVFATIDKQAAQSRGSRWKQEPHPTGDSPLRSTKGKRSTKKERLATDLYRRSGLIEEAKWVKDDGKLLWVFSMEKFRRLKAYSPRIKAFVYGIGAAVTESHSQAHMETPDLPERWLKLQNSPFGGEILITSTFSPGAVSSIKSSPKRRRLSTNGHSDDESTANRMEAVSTTSAVVSDESGEYLQIGDNDDQDIFLLSVFVQAAFNLSKVVEGAIREDREDLKKKGFWLSYSLFDVIVQTDVFFNLSIAEFSPIRDSFRVKSNLEELALCVESLGTLTVFLCTENCVLAGVEIPLLPLLTQELFRNDKELKSGDTAVVEGNFSFLDFDEAVVTASAAVEFLETAKPKAKIAQQTDMKQATDAEAMNGDSTEQDTLVSISAIPSDMPVSEPILLQLDHLRLKISALAPFTGAETISVEVSVGNERYSSALVFCTFTKHHAFGISPAVGVLVKNISSLNAMDYPIRIRCFSSDSNQLIAASAPEARSVTQDDAGFPSSIMLQMRHESTQTIGQCRVICTRGLAAQQKVGRELLEDAGSVMHHYQICLNVKSVRNVEPPGGYSLRYHNPFLRSALSKAVFSLSYLFFSEEQFCCSKDKCEEIFMTQAEAEAHWLEVHTDSVLPGVEAGTEAYSHSYRSCSINIPILGTDGEGGSSRQSSCRVGSICVFAYLEDIGPLTDTDEAKKYAKFVLPAISSQEKEDGTVDFPGVVEALPEPAVRKTGEAKRYTSPTRQPLLVEVSPDHLQLKNEEKGTNSDHERQKEATVFRDILERERNTWKQEQHLQQLQWKRRFAEMEKARMDELEEEWARREEERSNLLKSAQDEYQRLEQILRKSLADLEIRERRLTVAEASLQREQEAKRDEIESLQRRFKSEQNHTLTLAKKQTEAYERRISLLETQLSEAEKRTKQVEADFAEYRQQQRKLPESRLREEIAALKGSVAELEKQKMVKERECELAEASVQKMKAQLEHMASLLAQEKKKHEAQAIDELEKLRMKYIAREEKYVLDGDRDELRAIKQQLDELKGFNFSRSRRSHKRHSPPPRQRRPSQQWHTQSRHTSSSSHQASRAFSDHVSINESDTEAYSYVGTNHTATVMLALPPHELKTSMQSRINEHDEDISVLGVTDEDPDDVAASTHSHEGSTSTELNRLIRERRLLLDSGAYDAQSYLVRELDRLINVMKANAEHQSSIA
ncbi:unnamed protein product [Phytophthora fragariaefolia]|uniref:Unnamed protein product n=1 Tax=Phytophthora fragariaefolia TaxID=1490495 RepID=A0A9W6X4L7_9STRA|nr:unnamed protein product [Phytophthora fragariaefolia]